MSSPQLENGFTRISNELLEGLSYQLANGLSGLEGAIVLLVIRWSYGYGVKEAVIKPSKIAKTLGKELWLISKYLKRLVEKGVIIRREGSVIGLNKDYESWLLKDIESGEVVQEANVVLQDNNEDKVVDNNVVDGVKAGGERASGEIIDAIVGYYKKYCPKMPRVMSIFVGDRIERVKDLVREFKDLGVIEEGFKKAGASKFLNGEGNGGWRANFDWIIKIENFYKILEGFYDDVEKSEYKGSDKLKGKKSDNNGTKLYEDIIRARMRGEEVAISRQEFQEIFKISPEEADLDDLRGIKIKEEG